MLRVLTAFARNQQGATLIFMALTLPVLLGFVGLATDTGYWLFQRGRLQNATDAAAIAAAAEMNLGSSDAQITAAAQHDAALNGFTNGGNAQMAVTIDHNANTALVHVTAQPSRFFSVLFLNSPVTIAADAKGGVNQKPVCILALNASGNTISLSGGSSILAKKCTVYSDSSSSKTVNVSGGSTLTADSTCVVGTYGGGAGYYTPVPQTGCGTKADPYASVPPPSYGWCDSWLKITVNGGTRNFSPGVYCGGITLASGAVGTFQPGVYVIKNGDLVLSGGSSMSGSGVGFYFVGSGSNLNASGGSGINLTAASTGPLAGIVFFQDRAITGTTNVLSGGSGTKIDGLIYFPTNTLNLSGGSSGSMPQLTGVVAGAYTLSGGSTWVMDPYGSSVSKLAIPVTLVQ